MPESRLIYPICIADLHDYAAQAKHDEPRTAAQPTPTQYGTIGAA